MSTSVKHLFSLSVLLLWIGYSVPASFNYDKAYTRAGVASTETFIKAASSGREKENYKIDIAAYEVEDDELNFSRRHLENSNETASIHADQTLALSISHNKILPIYRYFSYIFSFRYHYLIFQVFRI